MTSPWIKAHTADRMGNLVTARRPQLRAVMATAATTVMAQVSEVVDRQARPRAWSPQGIYVDRRCGDRVSELAPTNSAVEGRSGLLERGIAGARTSAGAYVNLGIGLPTTVADHLDPRAGVVLHTENGMLSMGRAAVGDEIDLDLINAGKIPVTELPGASYFHHADSFAMMRGGHLDICVLGAFQVSAAGDLANWHTGGADAIPAVGGAMDLAIGAKQVFVMMTLFAKDGSPNWSRTAPTR